MQKKLHGLKVALLVADGFERSEMVEPRKALQEAGASVELVSPIKNNVKSWAQGNWAESYHVDTQLDKAIAHDYDALVLPGGVINPDHLRCIPRAIEFIKEIYNQKKPIAAICHGPWTLINAGVVIGKHVTSWPSLKIDLENGGAHWVDKEVVRDGNLVTSRKPEDLTFFNDEMIKLFSEYVS
ncbi:MAG: type 1 glutamine amidotransferase [Candidatus Babeliaceae bacterium]|nr:type 1 glutamine amidotransferase [Candidatus Babeliaceae bacterium]